MKKYTELRVVGRRHIGRLRNKNVEEDMTELQINRKKFMI